MTHVYALKDVAKKFGDGRVVLDIESLTVARGEIVALLGPNGSGKTTLLHLLAFLYPPSEGEIFFLGEKPDYSSAAAMTALRRRAVLVRQSPVLFSTSVLANVEYPLRVRGIDRERREAEAMEALARVGMTSKAGEKGKKLSGGETQRVAVAQAIAAGTEVVLMDEPTASVDAASRAAIEETILWLTRERGGTVVMATHDPAQALRLGARRIHLEDGRVFPDPAG